MFLGPLKLELMQYSGAMGSRVQMRFMSYEGRKYLHFKPYTYSKMDHADVYVLLLYPRKYYVYKSNDEDSWHSRK